MKKADLNWPGLSATGMLHNPNPMGEELGLYALACACTHCTTGPGENCGRWTLIMSSAQATKIPFLNLVATGLITVAAVPTV